MNTSETSKTGKDRLSGLEIAIMIGFWALIAALTLVRRGMDFRGPSGLTESEFFYTLIEYGTWALVTPLAFYVLARFPFERENWKLRLGLHVLLAFVVACVVDMIHTYAITELLFDGQGRGRGRPQPPFPAGALRSVTRFWFIDELIVYGAILATAVARQYFRKYREREAAALQLEAQLTEARMDALRMQLNPHFLFNTLHAVSALVERDPSGVRRMIARLSDLLRHSLEGDSQEVTLRNELDILDSYLEIQQVRFQDSLQVELDVPLEMMDALLPNLILQPLAENAVQHGVSKLAGQQGQLTISAGREGGWLVIEIADNGPGLEEGYERSAGVGITNTRARLEGLYGSEATLTLENREFGGCVARLRLPYHTRPLQNTESRSDA
ncbi:MAG: histidine kinase [Rubricoccaceae bacterium]|nr:histidine kinase [Rubricoccaceae bacterium]